MILLIGSLKAHIPLFLFPIDQLNRLIMKDSKIILKAVDGWTQRTLGLFLTALEKDQSLNIICSDGSVKSSILILAAISPVLKEIGRQFPACCQDIFHVILPDFCVSQIERFLENLGSEKGPQNSEESFEFERILAFFGRQSFLPSVGIKDEVPMSNLDKIPFSDFVPDSYETNLEECWPTSEDVKEEDEEMISPKCKCFISLKLIFISRSLKRRNRNPLSVLQFQESLAKC